MFKQKKLVCKPVSLIDQGADHILSLKGNQSGLFEDVQWLFEQAQAVQLQDVAHDECSNDRQRA